MAGPGRSLPEGWSQHQSSRCPGRVYYFNSRTGARTWNIKEVVTQILETEEPGRSKTDNAADYSISELEKMLEHKRELEKKRKFKEGNSSEHPESDRSNKKNPSKRQKVVSDPSNKSAFAGHKGKSVEKNRATSNTPPTTSGIRKLKNNNTIHRRSPDFRTPPHPSPDTSLDNTGDIQSSSRDSHKLSKGDATSTSVKELQDEELMEWETIDMESIIKETQKAREMVYQTMDMEEDKSNDSSAEVVTPRSGMVMVIDTNVFISSLNVVTQILETEALTVLVPWMVVQELDRLKTSEKKDTGVRARAAVRLLNSLLLSRPRNLVTQTASQSKAVATKYLSQSPDDRILGTCLDSIESGMKIFLVSNDVNLCNKALISGVQCGSSDNLFHVINEKGETLTGLAATQDTGDFSNKKLSDNLIVKVSDVVRDLLEGVLRKEFQEAYGEKLWEKMVSIKPQPIRPYWSLKDLFTLFSKHHIAVFGLCFPKNGNELKEMIQSVKEKLSVKAWSKVQDAEAAITEVLGLIDVIGNREDYDGLVTSSRSRMMESRQEIEEFKSTSEKEIVYNLDIDTLDTEFCQKKIESHLTAVWGVILAFTRAFAEAYKVPHDLPRIQRVIHLQPQSMIEEQLSRFYSAVDGVQRSMLDIVGGTASHVSVFHDKLMEFQENKEFQLDEKMSRQEMQWFFTRPENAELVRNGLEQITTFRQILIQCISGNRDSH